MLDDRFTPSLKKKKDTAISLRGYFPNGTGSKKSLPYGQDATVFQTSTFIDKFATPSRPSSRLAQQSAAPSSGHANSYFKTF